VIDGSLAKLTTGNDTAPILPDRHIRTVGHAMPGLQSWALMLAHVNPDEAPTPKIDIDDLVSIQFTSGTTGFPKGCRLTHRYWLTAGKVNARRHGRDYRRILASTPFTYMDPHWLLLMAIYQRGTLYVARKQSLTRFVGWLHEHRVNFCLLPLPLLKQPPQVLDTRNEVIRANIFGLQGKLHAEVEARFNLTARQAFGMTEIGSGMFMPIEAVEKVGSGSCGIPSQFRRVRIADATGREVRVGETGELLVQGPGIFQGYHRNPEATREAFHGEWFRTGDLFRRDTAGYYYLVGRVKDVVRRAGENTAAREVEAVIRELPAVYDVAVVPVPDEVRGEEVKAYIVPSNLDTPREHAVSAKPPEKAITAARRVAARAILMAFSTHSAPVENRKLRASSEKGAIALSRSHNAM
jgi:acyl-CoA synthetase (AMP-forming)/AMP-acid ligase II